MIPRLSDYAHQLCALHINRLMHQRISVFHDIGIIALRKLNLEEVVRDNLSIVVAILQSLKTLRRLLILAARIVYIRLIVDCMVSIVACERELREMVIRLIVVTRDKLDVALTHIVLLLIVRAQSLVVDNIQEASGTSKLLALAEVHRQHKANLVGIWRLRIATQECEQDLLQVVIAQLRRTTRQRKVNIVHHRLIINRNLLAQIVERVTSLAISAEIHKRYRTLSFALDLHRCHRIRRTYISHRYKQR